MNIEKTNIPEDLELASLGKRIKAHLVDFIVMLPFLSIMIYAMFKSQSLGLKYYFMLTIFYSIIFIGYRIFFAFKYGGTLGKLAVKIKIIGKNQDSLSIRDSFLREIPHIFIYIIFIINVYLMFSYYNDNAETLIAYDFSSYFKELEKQELFPNLSTYYYILSILFILFNKMKKTPHDFLANSIVILNAKKSNVA
ncbi:RDD family protein [Leptospira bourretii]|uniref:RDD family protein n=1 Tax=Leptospira bourretii TaxID=2484962 RepID=UPI00109127D3|nr:RDD family protein [Leptospira bourretii]TGL19750.1 RDD family protein [Leptospira bourretii]